MNDMNRQLLLMMGKQAKQAARQLSFLDSKQKDLALVQMAKEISKQRKEILDANKHDIAAAREKGLSKALLERLTLDDKGLDGMVQAIYDIAKMADPIGEVLKRWERPNGLLIEQVRTPLGVIGIIYESRPNVTADAAALCLKSGNACILRGGSDAFLTSQAIYQAIKQALSIVKLPEAAIQLVETRDRAAVGLMLSGLEGTIDVIIPRGGKTLVSRVQQEAKVPIFAHLEGICHIYIDKSADLTKAKQIALNAKMRRTSVCGAMETLLFDKGCSQDFISEILDHIAQSGCKLRLSADIYAFYNKGSLAQEEDFGKEFLDAILSVKLVNSVEGAIAHIEHYSSHHTEAIIAEDAEAVKQFFQQLDSAILLHNASTQFADGAEFGYGSEIGIATGKMHARGPIGLQQLCSFQYHIHGTGQIRA